MKTHVGSTLGEAGSAVRVQASLPARQAALARGGGRGRGGGGDGDGDGDGDPANTP
ncbi:hypothetical protein ACFWBF_34595 [Streptomyces sp. NPDC060028]|uniref:hypothetical protein n=1 Tax=Streptomyces sp. NPDC060028 TaxID=3347041 RepID=UPI0036A96A78